VEMLDAEDPKWNRPYLAQHDTHVILIDCIHILWCHSSLKLPIDT
jgi:hypothetical protein